jgi:hypothetical protein
MSQFLTDGKIPQTTIAIKSRRPPTKTKEAGMPSSRIQVLK